MSPFPITPLVRRVQSLILQTFDVSEERAQDYAADLVALAEGWGSPESAAKLDWSYRIRKDLGETRGLKWRSQKERAEFEQMRKEQHRAYENLIRKRTP